MPVTDDRLRQLARFFLFDPGQGEPVPIDHGHGSKYDVLAQSAMYGSIARVGKEFTLEYLPGVGLCCRPFLTLQDTRSGHYSTQAGTWEERKPATGVPNKYRLFQLDTTAGLEFHTISGFPLPANPDVAFSMIIPATPPDHDPATHPPFLRFELGNAGQWALEFSKEAGSRLLKKVNKAWVAVMDLPEPQTFGNSENEEVVVLFRCLRGMFAISTDRGRNYTFYSEPGQVLTVSSASYAIRGQGGQCMVGLHQLLYYTGVYTSARWSTFTTRVLPAVSVTVPTHCRKLPSGTNIVVADTGEPGAQIAGYTATLTPASTNMATPGWAVYRTPELYAVPYEFPVTVSTPTLYAAEPYAGAIQRAAVRKPLELDAATGGLTVRKDAATQFTFRYGRWPKFRLDLGHVDTSDVTHYTTAMVGYVRAPSCSTETFNASQVDLALDNISVRFKRAKWSRMNRLPLGGQTVNAALLAIFASEGATHLYPAHLRHPKGDWLLLPAGLAEDPFEWPSENEEKWETLTRIAGYAGLDLVPLDSGYFETIPFDYISPVLNKTWEMQPVSELKNLVESVTYGYDSAETVTAIEVYGVSEWGEELVAYYVNGNAEANPMSGGFCPWRETVVEQMQGTCTMPILAARCQALALELCGLKQEADVSTLVDLTTSRRDRGTLTGSTVGINDTDQMVVLTLDQFYTEEPGFKGCKSVAGLRRIL